MCDTAIDCTVLWLAPPRHLENVVTISGGLHAVYLCARSWFIPDFTNAGN